MDKGNETCKDSRDYFGSNVRAKGTVVMKECLYHRYHLHESTFDGETTPPVQAIAVLTNDGLDHTLLHQLHKHHVSGRRNGLGCALGLDVAAPEFSMSTKLPHTWAYRGVTSCIGQDLLLPHS